MSHSIVEYQSLSSRLRRRAAELRDALPMRPLVYATADLMEEAAQELDRTKGKETSPDLRGPSE